ncbi:PDPK1 family serine/threonine-protein kinase, partial [Ascoidea rubescens DSM 1968]
SDDWEEKGAAQLIKTIKSSDGKSITRIIRRSVKDFEFGKTLGEGSYSTVKLSLDKNTSKYYAIKILDKRHIIKEKKVKYVTIEKDALNRLSSIKSQNAYPNGIVKLYFTFQDENCLYFVLDYASNGELLSLIKKYGSLNENSTRYFAAQIIDALEFMHNNGVIHRDLKPENILLDSYNRVEITDFGTAKLLLKDPTTDLYPKDTKAYSFVGTAEYVSPELLNDKYSGKPSDIWSFGCILYQLIAGKPPFKATNEYLTFQQVMKI